MRAAISRPRLASIVVLGGIIGAFGCFGGRALTDPTGGGPGAGFRSPDPVVTVITLAPTAVKGKPGQTNQVTAIPKDQSGNTMTNASFTWSSSNTRVATVSSTGLVTLVHSGTATVAAASGDVTASLGVTVDSTLPPGLSSLSMTPTSANLNPGQTQQFTATGYDASGHVVTGTPVDWASSNSGVASVSGSGLVRAVIVGTAVITATSGGHAASAYVQVVSSGGGGLSSLSLTPTSANLNPGQTVQFTATGRDASGNVVTGTSVSWASSNSGAASVSSSGLVEANIVGTAVITATGGGHAASAYVQVVAPGGGGGGGGGTTHEPAGMSVQINTGAMTGAPSSYFTIFSPTSTSSTGENAANLTSVPGGSGVRINYPTNLSGGYSPVRFGRSIGSAGNSTYYQRWRVRTVPNWAGPRNGNGVKMCEPRQSDQSQTTGTNHILMMWPNGGQNSQMSAMEGLQGPYGHARDMGVNQGHVASLTDGQWHTDERIFIAESSPGAGNGQYYAYLDGVLVAAYTDVNWLAAGGTWGITYWMVDPTFGGAAASDHPLSGDFWDFDQLYVSTK